MPNPLLALLQGGGSANDPLELANLRGARQSEAQNRAIMSIGTDRPDARAAGISDYLGEEMAADPSTGTAARGENDAIRQLLTEASLYDDPRIAGPRREQEAVEYQTAVAPHLIKAQADAQAKSMDFERNLYRDQQQNEMISGRQEALQNQRAENAKEARAYGGATKAAQNYFRQAEQLRKQAEEMGGLWNGFKSKLGMSDADKYLAEAERLQSLGEQLLDQDAQSEDISGGGDEGTFDLTEEQYQRVLQMIQSGQL